MNDVKLSIIVTVYNHYEYIEECLNSILMQKVNFSYEVLIGEDCSTDATRTFLKQLEYHFPPNFKFYYNEKNYGMGPSGNSNRLYKKAVGKYHIALEGDDYWLYDQKLQYQYDFLEANTDYSAIAHRCLVVDEYSKPNGESYPECKNSEYTMTDFFNGLLPGQYTTTMRRAEISKLLRDFQTKTPDVIYPADQLFAFLSLMQGRVKCVPEIWSAYRHVTGHGSSFSANWQANKQYAHAGYLLFKEAYSYSKEQNHPQAMLYIGKIYYRRYFSLCMKYPSDFSPKNFAKDLISEKKKINYVIYIFQEVFKQRCNKLKACALQSKAGRTKC